jgi:hypothetical protein
MAMAAENLEKIEQALRARQMRRPFEVASL